MSRRTRVWSWLAAVLILLSLAYAGLPWMLATVVRHTLAAQGVREIQLKFDYPHWHGIRLHALAFTVDAKDTSIRIKIPSADISYQLGALVQGRLDRIQVPLASLQIQSGSHRAASAPNKLSGQSTPLPLAALASGQWLTRLPLREMALQRLTVAWHKTPKLTYALQLSGQLQKTKLEFKGHVSLPPLPKPIDFSFYADHKGKADLLLTAGDVTAKPLLNVAVTSVDANNKPFKVNGTLHTRLQALMPILRPWLQQFNQVTGVEGELQSQWHVRVNDSTWQLTGDATLDRLTGQWRDQVMPMSVITAKYTADAKQATLQASLLTANKVMVLQADGVQQFASGRGHARIILLPVEFKKSVFVLSQLFKSWPYHFDVNAGQASADVQLQWFKMLKSAVQIHLKQIGGYYNKMAFRGVNGEMALTMDKGIVTSKPAHLQVALLDVGFPVEHIDAKFTLEQQAKQRLPVVKMHRVSANLLGGKAYSGPFELDFAKDKNAFVVQLEHIDLNKIMQLERQQDLQGSGLIDGQIPISLSHEGIAVEKGLLTVRAPGGVIRYTPTPRVASLAKSNPNMNMIVDVLRNFQYQVMNIRSDYASKGDLKLQVRLEGRNPDWQGGKPVHLNLNLQENVPILLRSLQLDSEISERVREHYQTAPQ